MSRLRSALSEPFSSRAICEIARWGWTASGGGFLRRCLFDRDLTVADGRADPEHVQLEHHVVLRTLAAYYGAQGGQIPSWNLGFCSNLAVAETPQQTEEAAPS